jgi:hypothetical protein
MRNGAAEYITSQRRVASQLSISSQGSPLRRRGHYQQDMPVASPSKPQSSDMRISEIGIGAKRQNPTTQDTFDDSFLKNEDLHNMIEMVDKRQKTEQGIMASSEGNFEDSLDLTSQTDIATTQQIVAMIQENGATLKELILTGLDFVAVEDSISYLLSSGQIYERGGRFYLL